MCLRAGVVLREVGRLTAGRHCATVAQDRKEENVKRLIPYPTLLRTPDLGDTVALNIIASWPASHHLPLALHAY